MVDCHSEVVHSQVVHSEVVHSEVVECGGPPHGVLRLRVPVDRK